MKREGTIASLRTTLITTLVIGSFASDVAFAPRAEASLICAGLFQPQDAKTESTLPPALALLLNQISPRQRLKFERRFEKRDEVSAEREATRLLARLLIKNDAANLKLKPLIFGDMAGRFSGQKNGQTRADSVKSLLSARLDAEANRIELENTLLEIGFAENSAPEWRAFRDRYNGQLAFAKNFAINLASTYFLGLPFFLTKVKTAGFKASKADRIVWPEVEQKLRSRIDSGDPALVRRVKYEVAIDFVRRLVAIAVLAMLTDEFLTYLTPKWSLLKMKVRGSVVVESRERLEAQALENWKDIAEAFEGIRPLDDSAEAQDILARIKATSTDDLWIHVHEGGSLTEPRSIPPASAVPQTN
ncbi:hypothetical protein BH10BDE1_BH10BDE1_10690 [soil metagenome]